MSLPTTAPEEIQPSLSQEKVRGQELQELIAAWAMTRGSHTPQSLHHGELTSPGAGEKAGGGVSQAEKGGHSGGNRVRSTHHPDMETAGSIWKA